MKKRVTASLFAAIMAASLLIGVTPVHAYSTTLTGSTTTVFDSYLIMNKGAKTPNVTVTYQISAGTAKASANGNPEVLAGLNPSSVTMSVGGTALTSGQVKYTTSDTMTTKTDKDTITGYDATTQQYVAKEVTLDFKNCKFDQPGIYRYNISEAQTTNNGVTLDKNTYALDVYVENNDNTGTQLKISGVVAIANKDDNAPAVSDKASTYAGGKVTGFCNYYTTSSLGFKNRVAGNLSSRDKYFEYTVNITGVSAGSTYAVDIAGAQASPVKNSATKYTSMTNPTSVTASANTITQKFYLKHGQYITIKDLPVGASYTVSVAKEDYTINGKKVTDFTDKESGTFANATSRVATAVKGTDVKTSFILTRGAVPDDPNDDNATVTTVLPTGVVMNVAPFAAAVLLGGIGAMMFAARKKEEDEEV